jgi:hypothetical protein
MEEKASLIGDIEKKHIFLFLIICVSLGIIVYFLFWKRRKENQKGKKSIKDYEDDEDDDDNDDDTDDESENDLKKDSESLFSSSSLLISSISKLGLFFATILESFLFPEKGSPHFEQKFGGEKLYSAFEPQLEQNINAIFSTL